MMFHGSERYPREVYNEIITKIGADANAYTSDDMTVYLLDIAADTRSPMQYESEKPDDVLAEDRQIENYVLGIDAANAAVVSVDDMFERSTR